MTPRAWTRLASLQVVAFGTCFAYWFYKVEFGYVDTANAFDYVGRVSWSELVRTVFSGSSEYRPGQMFFVKLVYDLAGGPSQVAFRSLELLLLGTLVVLFFRLLPPRSEAAWFGFTVGLCCLFGLHTSRAIFVSTIPLGHALLLICILLFGSLVLLRQRPALVVDVSAAFISLVAIFHIEGGILVAGVWVLAGACRWGAARWRTAGGVLVVVALYGAIRVLTNTDPLPGPFYTETGFLLQENLSLEEQAALFTGREWIFHGYNALSTLFTVLFSEPREGVFLVADAFVNGTPVRAWQLANWVISLGSTVLIIGFAFDRWRSRDHDALRLLLIGGMVLLLNAVLGYLYTRDRIPGPAGACYALLLGVAVEEAWKQRAEFRRGARRTVVTVCLGLLAIGWAYRAAGTIVWTRDTAWAVRDEWTDRYERLVPPSEDSRTNALRQLLRGRAVRRALPNPNNDPAWMSEFFERKH